VLGLDGSHEHMTLSSGIVSDLPGSAK
jgi:hypothetical protein